MKSRFNAILTELKSHSPFTLFGAATGILCMFLFRNLEHNMSRSIFYIFHPAHVLLSAVVTTALFRIHEKRTKFVYVFIIGFIGSIGIGTLSDSLIPYIGEVTLGMRVELHDHEHEQEHEGFAEKAHIGFIERWYIVIPAAIIGVLIGYLRPKTKFTHAGHVLLSMWASSFHILMAMGGKLTVTEAIGSFVFLFLAVMVPCCFSDIIFPLLFVKSGSVSLHHHH